MKPQVNPSFSIITSCYRGAKFLPRAFESLKKLKGGYSYEWILVDDFSDDGDETRQAIQKIEKEAPFPAKGIFLDKNYLSCRSTYTGSKIAKGSYTMILDQDDLLTEDALEIFSAGIKSHEDVEDFAGVFGRCIDMEGRFIGTPFPGRGKISNQLRIRHIDKIRGELFVCNKTHLIRSYFEGMKVGHTNGWVWNRIARHHNHFFTNGVVRIYDTGNPHSISHSRKILCPDVQFEELTEYLTENEEYLNRDRLFCFRMMIQWSRLGFHLKSGFQDQNRILPKKFRHMLRIAYPLAAWKANRDVRIGKI